MVAFFQAWQSFSQANPIFVPYITLLGGKVALFGLFVFFFWVGARLFKAPQGPDFDVPWGMGSVVEIYLFFIAFQAVAIFFKTPHMGDENLEGIIAIWSTLEYLFLLVMVWCVLRFVLGQGLGYAGWAIGKFASDWPIAIRGILFIGVVAGILNFLYWTEILTPSSKIEYEVSLSGIFAGGVFSSIHVVLVLLISPICEETFYRGFAYPVLRNRLPKLFSILLVSSFFAAVHFQWSHFLYVFLMSWAATEAFDRTKRLFASMCIHSVYNALVLSGVFTY
jgi:membrane protease YdiL (CAAX protease family)